MCKFIYKCVNCGKEYQHHEVRYTCQACTHDDSTQPPKGVLKVVYDYESLAAARKSAIKWQQEKYLDILPIRSLKSLPPLKVGRTPVYYFEHLSKSGRLFFKDDSQNPTYSFKDRASAIVSAFAKESGIKKIAAASTGNAGSSLAGICASQGQKSVIFVPADAPVAKITQILMYGAQIVLVKGTYDDAFDLSIAATKEWGWFNRNTAYNPLTIEGKKTVAFEVFEQFKGQLPDYIFVPVGDGVILSGVYKGFEDLLKLGLIERIPTIVTVQAKGSSNVILNLNSTFQVFEGETVADSISVNVPRNFYMARDYIKTYKGLTAMVSDYEILEASARLSKHTGLFSEPAAAAAYAGFIQLQKMGKIEPSANCLVLLTGSGLKDLSAVKHLHPLPKAIECDLNAVKKLLD